MNKVIDCKAIAQKILDEVKTVPEKKALLAVSVGEDKAFQSYLKGLEKDCKYCGITLMNYNFLENDLDKAYRSIRYASMFDSIGGVIVQDDIPTSFRCKVSQAISCRKDIDGLTGGVPPCTAEAVLEILKTQYDDLTGKNALVVGRGRVGKAVAEMLLSKDCTVTIAHSKTDDVDLTVFIQYSDIIVSAAGKPVIDCNYCCDSVIIDCGTSVGENGEIEGDLYNIEKLSECNFTPVPNGVGLVTRAVLLRRLAKEQNDVQNSAGRSREIRR